MRVFTERKVWFAIFVLVVFVAGAAAGALASRYLLFGRGAFGVPPAPPRPAEIVDRMSRDLGLTAEQRRQLETVFERNGERLEALRIETGTRFEALRKQIDAEIVAILTPEQRARFDEQRKRLERGRPPGRLPGPLPPPPR